MPLDDGGRLQCVNSRTGSSIRDISLFRAHLAAVRYLRIGCRPVLHGRMEKRHRSIDYPATVKDISFYQWYDG